ncbi:16S rRNA (adenine(1518)-N(6)/adenine(1519)-N(6))-dimethyltransferase RsmA [uncultured Veillonella sp.]|uniref:16S rRNA (adenine(1518)-N(6)/adenine(1519)-N(6))- dimethyltransferase RsmA n=1 Tax=uncultured Veillonella sp. TaxID=159268 RepID=UPI0025D8832E|nr:16S rRNA (adenine(1518)-N(6)/adenine(1519)-N(6))-dimethyltransferase RsmA [uncultured Veillonella sp.]MDY3974293.1 16S rRNA (adenine(1518)-N(6)/adenine(1519)-N(6))-dimethyltransferase RsmA [Veillonella caviae]
MLESVIASPEVVHYICKRFGIHMSKKLGQNFLISRRVVDDIVRAAELEPGEPVLEVGPGIGTLTQGLAQSGASVTAVELDRRLLEVLDHTLESYDNVQIVHGDILKVNIPELMNYKPFKVVANLPYYITTPIIMSLLEMKLPIERLVVMVQKEVAERMVATPGTKAYGALSVAVQYYTEPEIVFDVLPKSFLPAPEVTSSVVRCKLRPKPPVDVMEEAILFRVIKAAFAQRRKTFSNTMKTTGLKKEQIEAILTKAGIDGNRRGETFDLQEFATIANAWSELYNQPSQ